MFHHRWKLNVEGELDYHGADPEKIREMEPYKIKAHGVNLSSRYGQVSEMIAMLKFVRALHAGNRDTLRAIESIDWDSKGCAASITMRAWLPGQWQQSDADGLALIFYRLGGPYNVYVETPHKSFECEGQDESDPDDEGNGEEDEAEEPKI